MHRSYVPALWIDYFLVNNNHDLPDEVVKRFFIILRIKPKEKISVFDGQGREIIGLLVYDAQRKKAHFNKGKLTVVAPCKYPVIVIQAALIESKLSETIKRGIEIGVDNFIIYNAKLSEPYCYKKAIVRQERLIDLAIDASRQCGRVFVPQIIFKDSLSMVLKSDLNNVLGIYGDISGNILLSSILKQIEPISKSLAVIVGPEGGFSKQEITELNQAHCVGVKWAPFKI
jgi:16S rRNA (uracil1498-N3)-methyltransferase